MAMPKVFIDGHAGTTGLRIREWLEGREDVEFLTLRDDQRRDAGARREYLDEADLAILCLPDEVARETALQVEDGSTRILDASSVHRVAEGWAYGLPELQDGLRESIRTEDRVSNPGCYASAVVLAVRPLVDSGDLPADAPLTVHALSGYSGGGRNLIEKWEDRDGEYVGLPYEAPYAMGSVHKHIPEMTRYSGLRSEPHFTPAVGPFKTGMRVEIPLHDSVLSLDSTPESIWSALNKRYASEKFVDVIPLDETLAYDEGEARFDPRVCNDTNRMEIAVVPNPLGHVLLMVRLDNLGKGASGVAIQNMNLMLGLPEDRGLPV